MRRILISADPFPPSAEVIAKAHQFGAGEIMHQGDAALLVMGISPDMTGYVEIAERGDSLDEKKADALKRLADHRLEASQSTLCTAIGAPFTAPCDTAAGVNVTGSLVSMQLPGGPQIRLWKCGPGDWRDFTLADLAALGQVMAAHVQACFDNEGRIAALIANAADESALAAIYLKSGWSA